MKIGVIIKANTYVHIHTVHYIEIFPFQKFLIWFSNTFLFPNYPCSQKQQQQHSMSKHAIHFKFPAFIDFLHLVEIKVTRHYFYLLFFAQNNCVSPLYWRFMEFEKKRSYGCESFIRKPLQFHFHNIITNQYLK